MNIQKIIQFLKDSGQNCGIYTVKNPIGKIYLGQSEKLIQKMKEYRSANTQATGLYDSFRKYTVEKHDFEILCFCEPEALNNQFEVFLYHKFMAHIRNAKLLNRSLSKINRERIAEVRNDEKRWLDKKRKVWEKFKT